jgi:hypothetical protein
MKLKKKKLNTNSMLKDEIRKKKFKEKKTKMKEKKRRPVSK